jgi:hypothetical protein
MERYTAMMQRNMPDVKPSQARHIMLRGVVEYPYNPLLLSTYAQTTASTYHLRRFFDDSSERLVHYMGLGSLYVVNVFYNRNGSWSL